jgi:hypothetical protein
MAGNTRGKLKEEFEGIHKDFDWITKHLAVALVLIQEHNPKLSESIKSLAQGVGVLDELAMGIYSRL